jgi:hypothetical protein
MKACWRRLTQPEKTRSKKASGEGSESMAEACPRHRSGSRCEPAVSQAHRSGRGCRGTSLLDGVDTPIFREIRSLGRVFAPRGVAMKAAALARSC